MRIAAIIQARACSTRFPGKVLKDLPYASGITVLQQVIRRLRRCKKIDDVIVATTIGQGDDGIVGVAEKERVKYFRGSEQDVLSRYYGAAKENEVDVIVRITSDCPCIGAQVVDAVVERHIADDADYTSNTLIRTFPHGLDTEVLSFHALERTYLEAKEDFEREHVCPYIYKSNPESFKISLVEAPEALRAPGIRVTLDTEDDYLLLCAVFDYLYSNDEFFGTEDIIKLFRDKPWLKMINKNVLQKKIFNLLEDELAEAIRLLDIQELNRAKDILTKYLK